jgi:AraC-like DNA-binding protein
MKFSITQDPCIHRCESSWTWQGARFVDHDLWCVLGGHGQLILNGQAFSILPGRCWLFEPGQVCRASHDPKNRLRVLAVHFNPLTDKGCPRALEDYERPAQGVHVQDLALLEALARACVDACRRGGERGEELVLHTIQLIHLLLLQESSKEKPPALDPRISQIHDAILEDPSREWSVPAMAHAAALSTSQFSRLFRQSFGRSPARCVLEARVGRAGVLLRESSAPVGEIADALGYRDIFYFSRQFKALTGMTPSAWRTGAN